jgi:hypothetical protein
MNFKDRAKRDIARFLENPNDYNSIVFLAPTGQTATVTGIDSKIHLGVDEGGNPVNSKKATISVSESSLINAGYPVRDAKGEVALRRHKVDVSDSTGIVKKYVVQEIFPDETVGLITCILGDRD